MMNLIPGIVYVGHVCLDNDDDHCDDGHKLLGAEILSCININGERREPESRSRT